MLHPKNITNKWFYSSPPILLKILGIFVWGDAIVIAPFLIALGVLALIGFDTFFVLILMGLYLAVRSSGEMLYWLHQQFGPKTYRPYDFGFTSLNNNAIYILYQLGAAAHIAVWVSVVVYIVYLH